MTVIKTSLELSILMHMGIMGIMPTRQTHPSKPVLYWPKDAASSA